MVTTVCPPVGPDLGLIFVVLGAGRYSKLALLSVGLVPPELTTRTEYFVPSLPPAGVTAVSSVGDMTLTSVVRRAAAFPWERSPDVTPATKPVPTTVMVVPPLSGPLPGETEATVGTGSVWTEPASQDVSPKSASPR